MWFWTDPLPKGPGFRLGDNPGLQDVDRGVDIFIHNQSTGFAEQDFRPARMVPGAAPNTLMQWELPVHFGKLATGQLFGMPAHEPTCYQSAAAAGATPGFATIGMRCKSLTA